MIHYWIFSMNFVSENNIIWKPYAVRVIYERHDIPVKAGDKENLWESEEVY